jgi:hypothetical protein
MHHHQLEVQTNRVHEDESICISNIIVYSKVEKEQKRNKYNTLVYVYGIKRNETISKRNKTEQNETKRNTKHAMYVPNVSFIIQY